MLNGYVSGDIIDLNVLHLIINLKTCLVFEATWQKN